MELPQRISGERLALPDECRQVTIIGANGAGKSRFTVAFAKECGAGRTWNLSALKALYAGSPAHPDPATISALYEERAAQPGFLRNEARNALEKLISLLLNDEILALIEYKTAENRGELEPTKLDRVIALWRTMFPDSQVLRHGGALKFTREGSDDEYSSVRLSDGEKAVLYYFGAVLYAPEGATVFVDTPDMFLHPTVTVRLWNSIETLRRDCRFVYTTHNLDFAASRTANTVVWVKSYDAARSAWDYELLSPSEGLPEEVYMAIVGDRRPVLFIEGDGVHSIDAKLYPLVFPDYSVKSLGSCNKVIEAVRTFNDLRDFHHLESRGIVDRDRRDAREVAYLRRKNIFVPDVAEIENMLMLEDVVTAVASFHGRNPEKVLAAVKKSVMGQFRHDLRRQAMLHTRHRVKMTVEYRIDGRFTSINALEDHMMSLVDEINPRGIYEQFCREFNRYLNEGDYRSVLRVYNQKSMVPGSNVGGLCGLKGSRDAYVDAIINILKTDRKEARQIRAAIRRAFFGDENPGELHADAPERDRVEDNGAG